MQNWRQISHEAKDILTVCLAKAIDQALTQRRGSDWFANFADADAHEKVSNRITKPGQQSVRDLDLQALLKLLRYRSAMTGEVLTHFGFFDGLDDFAADDQFRQLNGLLDRLINDFRNRIEAHSRAADIEKELSGDGFNRIYGYEEAYQDMLKLARVFRRVTDHDGNCYYNRMAALTSKKPVRPKKAKKRKKWVLPLILGIVLVLAIFLGILAGGIHLIARLFAPNGDTPENIYRDSGPVLIQPDSVRVQPTEIYYENGSLVAVCYLTNGTDEAVSQLTVDRFQVFVDGETVAAATFVLPAETQILPQQSVQWKFRFPENAVFTQDADLAALQAKITLTWH